MEKKELNAKIETIGFKPSEIRPRKMWSALQNDLLELYNDYAELTNERIPELNSIWQALNSEEDEEGESEKDELTAEEQKIKDLEDEVKQLKYGMYLREAFEACAYQVNLKHPDSYLSGFVTMTFDGTPVFVGRIKQHPDLSMMFVMDK